MELLEHNSRIEVFDNEEALPETDRELLGKAQQATFGAYAPYSNFYVGAALRLEDGTVVTGNNQENAAYPAGLCAERVALFYASSNFPDRQVTAIAISARAEEFEISHPVTPCGSCRQVIAETESRQSRPVRILMKGDSGKIYITNGIANLLPFMFRADELKK